jgi:hypothetical protein
MIIGTLYGNSREKLHACKAIKIVAAGERRTSIRGIYKNKQWL